MTYATYNEVITRYPLIETLGKTASEVSSDLIYYSEIEINGRLGVVFSVPFDAAHPTIKDLTIDLAYYRAIRIKDPDKAEKLWKSVIGRIDDIKAGKEDIYTGSGTLEMDIMPGAEVWSTTQDYHPVHSMLDAEDPLTMVSSERLYDEANERI